MSALKTEIESKFLNFFKKTLKMQNTMQIHKKIIFWICFCCFLLFLLEKIRKNVKNWVITMIKKRKGKKINSLIRCGRCCCLFICPVANQLVTHDTILFM